MPESLQCHLESVWLKKVMRPKQNRHHTVFNRGICVSAGVFAFVRGA